MMWRQLERYLAGYESARLEWGVTDCSLFVAGWIAERTGVDVAAEFRGRYHDRREAARLVQTFAGGGLLLLARRVAEEHGFPEIAPLLARRGDVAAVPTVKGVALGLVDLTGAHVAALRLAGPGLERLPLTAARWAWRID